jgi:hypothetical protein
LHPLTSAATSQGMDPPKAQSAWYLDKSQGGPGEVAGFLLGQSKRLETLCLSPVFLF